MNKVDEINLYDNLCIDLNEIESIEQKSGSSDTSVSDENSSSSSSNNSISRVSESTSTTTKTKRTKVCHEYTDFSFVDEDLFSLEHPRVTKRGGVVTPFPERLHAMLENIEENKLSHVVSWLCHGRAFLVHKPTEFVRKILPVYFRQSKITSFQRQLNLYGFRRITHGPDSGAYYHCLFLRGRPKLLHGMVRVKIKGTGTKAANNPEQEPNFYTMPPVGPARKHSALNKSYFRRGFTTTFVTKSKTGVDYQQNVFRPSPLKVLQVDTEEHDINVSSPCISLQKLRNGFEPINTSRAQVGIDEILPSQRADHPLDQFSFTLLDFSCDNTEVAV